MKLWLTLLAAAGASLSSPASDCSAATSRAGEAAVDRPGAWMDSIQVYSYVATSIGSARHLGLTVNGVWNGCATENTAGSLLPETFLWRFRSAKAFVDNTHRAGMRHMSTIRCAFAHAQSFQEEPRLEDGVCRSLNGTFLKIPSWYIGNPCFMCQNSPVWQEYLLGLARRAVDSGTDAVVLDEPFGDTVFSGACGPDLPGYSDSDLALFAMHLRDDFDSDELRDTFGLSGAEPSRIRKKLEEVDCGKWSANPAATETTQADRLWFRFKRSQLMTNLAAKERLVEGIRSYTKQTTGKDLPIGANLAGLGTASLGAGAVPVLLMAGLFDFAAIEMVYPRVGGTRQRTLPFDVSARAKWMAWYKLGAAIWGPHRTLTLPSEGPFMEWITGEKRVNYLCHLFAEAYTGEGALLVNPVEEVAKEPVARYAKFVREHIRLYRDCEEVAPVAVLYSYDIDAEAHQWSYWGLAQALYESGVPFSTIYVTSEKSGWSELSPEALGEYEVVFIPMSGSLTEEQRSAVSAYVRDEGGTAIVLEADSGFSAGAVDDTGKRRTGRFIEMGGDSTRSSISDDGLGAAYWASYSDECRRALVDTALSCLTEGSPLIIPQNQREWSAVAYAQPDSDRAIVHVLNYDYDSEHDAFRPKEDVSIRLDPSAFGLSGESFRCTALSPDRDGPIDLACIRRGEYLEMTIPLLRQYELIICTPRRTD
jgi:hypothetical protein